MLIIYYSQWRLVTKVFIFQSQTENWEGNLMQSTYIHTRHELVNFNAILADFLRNVINLNIFFIIWSEARFLQTCGLLFLSVIRFNWRDNAKFLVATKQVANIAAKNYHNYKHDVQQRPFKRNITRKDATTLNTVKYIVINY